MDMKQIFEVIFGLVVLPVVAVFVALATANSSVSAIPGMTVLLPLIPLAIGFGMVYDALKGSVKK